MLDHLRPGAKLNPVAALQHSVLSGLTCPFDRLAGTPRSLPGGSLFVDSRQHPRPSSVQKRERVAVMRHFSSLPVVKTIAATC